MGMLCKFGPNSLKLERKIFYSAGLQLTGLDLASLQHKSWQQIYFFIEPGQVKLETI